MAVFPSLCAPQQVQSGSAADWRPPKSGDQEGDGRLDHLQGGRRPTVRVRAMCGYVRGRPRRRRGAQALWNSTLTQPFGVTCLLQLLPSCPPWKRFVANFGWLASPRLLSALRVHLARRRRTPLHSPPTGCRGNSPPDHWFSNGSVAELRRNCPQVRGRRQLNFTGIWHFWHFLVVSCPAVSFGTLRADTSLVGAHNLGARHNSGQVCLHCRVDRLPSVGPPSDCTGHCATLAYWVRREFHADSEAETMWISSSRPRSDLGERHPRGGFGALCQPQFSGNFCRCAAG